MDGRLGLVSLASVILSSQGKYRLLSMAAWQQSTIGNGERSSAATAYLGPEVRKRPNLSILLNAYVTRVLSAPSTTGDKPSFRTVEIGDKSTRAFVSSIYTRQPLTMSLPHPGRVLATVKASKEVILSAGVIGTPQILLNSGIGNVTELRAFGIEPTLNLPDVGKGLSDHTSNVVAWSANTRDPMYVLHPV